MIPNLLAILTLCGPAVIGANYFETFSILPRLASNQQRNALRMQQYKWPTAEVPFVFDAAYGMMPGIPV